MPKVEEECCDYNYHSLESIPEKKSYHIYKFYLDLIFQILCLTAILTCTIVILHIRSKTLQTETNIIQLISDTKSLIGKITDDLPLILSTVPDVHNMTESVAQIAKIAQQL